MIEVTRHTIFVIPGRAKREPGIHTHERAWPLGHSRKSKKQARALLLFAANAASRKRGVVMDSGPIATRCPGM